MTEQGYSPGNRGISLHLWALTQSSAASAPHQHNDGGKFHHEDCGALLQSLEDPIEPAW